MNHTQTSTSTPVLPVENQQHPKNTSISFLPSTEVVDLPLPPLTSIVPTFTELLTTYQTSVNAPPIPFIPNDPPYAFNSTQNNLAPATPATPQPVPWLWYHRLPLAGITLLDGDHGLGKTLLAHQIAAAVSSGTPMPDGSPTIQGGVIIVTPFTDPTTTQLQLLTSLGADLSRIEILSFLPNLDQSHTQTSLFPPCDTRPFSLPNDLTHLFAAIERVDARLILFDPFIYLLSSQHRYTKRHLCHLLTELNQYLLTHNIACLLVRNCRAKGGHAKPSTLEQSDHFLTIAASRLLLAPDPMQPDHILLSHALSRHCSLTQTLAFQIRPLPANPDLAHFTLQGIHTLQACHLLTQRPDTLYRHLLAQQLLPILAASSSPVAAGTLYALFPHSSISQLQHTLKDLLLQGHIQRPTRGFYSACPTQPKLNATAATTSQFIPQLNVTAATTSLATTKLNPSAATTPPITPKLDQTAATTPPITPKLNPPAATTPSSTPKLNPSAATTPSSTPKLNPSAATTTKPKTSLTHKHPPKQHKSHGRPGQHKKRS